MTIFTSRETIAAMEWSLRNPGQSHDEHQARIIMAEVAARFHVTLADLVGPRKQSRLAFARQQAMLRVRRETRLSYPAIAKLFNKKAHQTVTHDVRTAERALMRKWA